MPTKTKFFHSAMTGAPALSGTAGALVALLDALLVNGYGTTNVVSIVVAGGIATVTYASGHPFVKDMVGLFAGATPSGLNGDKRILSTTTNSLTFDATGISNQTATGTITSKVSPAGWEKAFSGTNLAAYRSLNVGSTRCYLRMNDTGTLNARFVSYESMTDVNTGLNASPLESQLSGGLYFPKSLSANSTARPWVMVADDMGFYLAVDTNGSGRYTVLYVGDISSLKSGDAYGFCVTGNQSDQTSTSSPNDGCVGYSRKSSAVGVYIQRSSTAVGQAVAAFKVGAHHNTTISDVYSGYTNYSYGTYPNIANNGLLTCPLELVVGASIRGAFPGLYHAVQDCANSFVTLGTVDGTDDLAGRKLMAIRVGAPGGSLSGTMFIDITGDWSR